MRLNRQNLVGWADLTDGLPEANWRRDWPTLGGATRQGMRIRSGPTALPDYRRRIRGCLGSVRIAQRGTFWDWVSSSAPDRLRCRQARTDPGGVAVPALVRLDGHSTARARTWVYGRSAAFVSCTSWSISATSGSGARVLLRTPRNARRSGATAS